jgi:hypothetical protein
MKDLTAEKFFEVYLSGFGSTSIPKSILASDFRFI